MSNFLGVNRKRSQTGTGPKELGSKETEGHPGAFQNRNTIWLDENSFHTVKTDSVDPKPFEAFEEEMLQYPTETWFLSWHGGSFCQKFGSNRD